MEDMLRESEASVGDVHGATMPQTDDIFALNTAACAYSAGWVSSRRLRHTRYNQDTDMSEYYVIKDFDRARTTPNLFR